MRFAETQLARLRSMVMSGGPSAPDTLDSGAVERQERCSFFASKKMSRDLQYPSPASASVSFPSTCVGVLLVQISAMSGCLR